MCVWFPHLGTNSSTQNVSHKKHGLVLGTDDGLWLTYKGLWLAWWAVTNMTVCDQHRGFD